MKFSELVKRLQCGKIVRKLISEKPDEDYTVDEIMVEFKAMNARYKKRQKEVDYLLRTTIK